MTKADDDLTAAMNRLEQSMPTMSREELEDLGPELQKIRKQQDRTVFRLEMVSEAIAQNWGKARFLGLLRTLLPPKRSGKPLGSEVPETWFSEIASRCPPETVTTVAREIVEREESQGNLTGEDRQKALKNRADYVKKLFDERKISP
jgi:hypothetical protein